MDFSKILFVFSFSKLSAQASPNCKRVILLRLSPKQTAGAKGSIKMLANLISKRIEKDTISS